MPTTIVLDGEHLRLEDIAAVARGGATVTLSAAARRGLERSRAVIEKILSSDQQVYGVNTGFGLLKDIRIPRDRLEELQLNLIRSHCAGVGSPLPPEATRALMLLRAHVLARGHSGVRPLVVETLLDHLNADLLPVVPEQGSLGASGDLAPLRLGPKEGLALINGTQFITAVGVLALLQAEELAAVADVAGALSLEAL